MRYLNTRVFDEFVPAATSSAPVYTKDDIARSLGTYNSLAIHVVTDNVNGATGTVNVQVQHSSDGRAWINKSSYATGAGGGGSPELSKPIGAGQTSVYGYEDGSMPSLEFVRLKLYFTGVITAGHVRIHVTARDRSGRPRRSAGRKPALRLKF